MARLAVSLQPGHIPCHISGRFRIPCNKNLPGGEYFLSAAKLKAMMRMAAIIDAMLNRKRITGPSVGSLAVSP
jgi:hypothetical protein